MISFFCRFFKQIPLFILLGAGHFVFAQDLYDASHTRDYAAYLMRGRQFGLAIEEYERLIFLHPANDTFRTQLLKACRLGGRTDQGLAAWDRWRIGQPDRIWSMPVRVQYANLLLSGGKEDQALLYSETPGILDSLSRHRTRLFSRLLLQQWADAQTELNTWPAGAPLTYRPMIQNLIGKGLTAPRKDPFLAATLSTVVPGLGKVYSGDWKDGLIGFVTIGLNGWLAWRNFSRDGVSSPWGWVHATIGTGFYIGNIYGAHKSARIFNQKQRHKLRHETNLILSPLFDQ